MHLDHIDKATVIKHQKRKFIISQNFSVKKPVNICTYGPVEAPLLNISFIMALVTCLTSSYSVK